ncbi:MAG: tRNA pseudouridine(38-40) synthase TruA [Bacteroidetes bacterium]|nr:tRNA pseudouridine(38-40) synthase TruA [Bacteroidota bacterium]MDA1118962.1 tRNA pseudouridine(38-40) synthase TruA [Bacteroidota bacterium]
MIYRYFLYLSYKGTNYHGWQVQKNVVAVQEVLNECLSTILRKKIATFGSGRTDTGVHAIEQVVHFDWSKKLNGDDFIYKLNSLLPKDIAANKIRLVKPEAHSRFDAIERAYIYQITTFKNPFIENQAYYFREPLDLDKMNALSSILMECKDYESFSRVKTDVNHFLCDVYKTAWSAEGHMITFKVTANRFLRGMVRTMVGTMLEVGLGNMSVNEFQDILASKNRKRAGMAVPPRGLFLQSVKYPGELFIG